MSNFDEAFDSAMDLWYMRLRVDEYCREKCKDSPDHKYYLESQNFKVFAENDEVTIFKKENPEIIISQNEFPLTVKQERDELVVGYKGNMFIETMTKDDYYELHDVIERDIAYEKFRGNLIASNYLKIAQDSPDKQFYYDDELYTLTANADKNQIVIISKDYLLYQGEEKGDGWKVFDKTNDKIERNLMTTRDNDKLSALPIYQKFIETDKPLLQEKIDSLKPLPKPVENRVDFKIVKQNEFDAISAKEIASSFIHIARNNPNITAKDSTYTIGDDNYLIVAKDPNEVKMWEVKNHELIYAQKNDKIYVNKLDNDDISKLDNLAKECMKNTLKDLAKKEIRQNNLQNNQRDNQERGKGGR